MHPALLLHRNSLQLRWPDAETIKAQSFTCAFCGREVASIVGWSLLGKDARGREVEVGAVAVCPRCDLPTFLTDGEQFPGVPYGSAIEYLPPDVDALYKEARDAMGVSAYTAAMMAGRKLLAHLAVEKGAPAGATFQAYVDYLVEHNIITADMKDWVDEIRQLGNEANHEIRLGAKEDADYVLDFVVMLLRIVYQFPEQARRSTQARAARKHPN